MRWPVVILCAILSVDLSGCVAYYTFLNSRAFRRCRRILALRTSFAFRGSPTLTALAATLLFAACAALRSAAPPLRTDSVLFWKVRGPETIGSEAYLLGSVHVGRADRPLVLDQRLAEGRARELG